MISTLLFDLILSFDVNPTLLQVGSLQILALIGKQNLIYSLYGDGKVLIYVCVWHNWLNVGLIYILMFGLWWGKTDIVGFLSYGALDLEKRK